MLIYIFSKNKPLEQTKATGFFFIIGRARSGTTLLRTMFDAHPNIKIPLESPLILELAKDFSKKETWGKADLLDFYQRVIRVKDFKKWGMDNEELKEKLLTHEGTCSFKELIDSIYCSAPDIFEKGKILLVGDKNPVYSIWIKQIFKLYPEAKYIHLQRDYRAHIVSMLKVGLFSRHIVALAYRWKYSAKTISKIKKRYPHLFFSLKYEELVERPEFYLSQLCDFLGLPFHADMLSFQEQIKVIEEADTKGKIEDHHKRIFQPVDTSRIDSWKEEMSADDIKIADWVVGRWAEKEGYKKQFTKFPINFRIKNLPALLIQRPWYFYQKIYDSLPLFYKNWRKGNKRYFAK